MRGARRGPYARLAEVAAEGVHDGHGDGEAVARLPRMAQLRPRGLLLLFPFLLLAPAAPRLPVPRAAGARRSGQALRHAPALPTRLARRLPAAAAAAASQQAERVRDERQRGARGVGQGGQRRQEVRQQVRARAQRQAQPARGPGHGRAHARRVAQQRVPVARAACGAADASSAQHLAGMWGGLHQFRSWLISATRGCQALRQEAGEASQEPSGMEAGMRGHAPGASSGGAAPAARASSPAVPSRDPGSCPGSRPPQTRRPGAAAYTSTRAGSATTVCLPGAGAMMVRHGPWRRPA